MMTAALREFRQQAATIAVRGAMSLPLLAGPMPSAVVAQRLARLWARARFNRKRLDRAVDHLSEAFPDWPIERRRDLACRAYEHLFQLGVELAFAPRLLNEDGWLNHVDASQAGPGLRAVLSSGPAVMVTGHCGNWEVLGYTMALLGFPMHALYRPLDLEPLDRWVRATRSRRGLELVDKFGATDRLPSILARGEPVAFVADQNAGDKGLFVPFFGRLASTYKSIGLVAIGARVPVVVGCATRVSASTAHADDFVYDDAALPGYRYRMSIQDVIQPQEWESQPDPLFYLTARYRRALEGAIRAAPEQYLWMHRIWKSRPRHEVLGRPFPKALEEKLRALPWLSDADVEAIKDRSARDARERAVSGADARPESEPAATAG
jgi:KDO2-lipid IV(A) lauroyltransferase